MVSTTYRFEVNAEDQDAAGRGARALVDTLRAVDGIAEVNRTKTDAQTMDLGSIVTVIATSGATLAIARGLAAWLQARRGVTLTVTRKSKDESLKAAVKGIDPETALRVVERVLDDKP
jgi:hypothetical protein